MQPRLVTIDSIAGLRAAAAAWDDLWRRSEMSAPTARAQLVAQWVEHFSPDADFRALAVEDSGRFVAALPLVGKRLGRVIEAGGLPSNEWSPGGQLLLDAQADADRALHVLAGATAELPWPLLWLDGVAFETPAYRALLESLGRAGLSADCVEQCRVGRIEIGPDWEAYRKTWSKNHRRNLAKAEGRLGRTGDLELALHSRFDADDVEPLLRRGFQVEDRSWKGEAGTSVLQTPGMFDFFVRQARQLSSWGQLELAFLTHDGCDIAFEYAFTAKGVYHSFKVGYDGQYAPYSPGQLLMGRLLKQFHGEPQRRAYDCVGPINDAVSKWKPDTYSVGRIVVAPRRLLGRVLLHAYKHWWPQIRRWRKGAVSNQRSAVREGRSTKDEVLRTKDGVVGRTV